MATFLNPDAIQEKSINFDKLNITPQDLGLSAALKYCGTTTTPLTDGATTNPIIIGGSNHTAESGCVVFYGDKEFIFNGAAWEEFGYSVDLSGYVEKVNGKGLSTNDYTTAEKTKLSGIASGAEVNVQSDWNINTTTSDSYIKNKPTIFKSTDSEGSVLNSTDDKFQIDNEFIFGNGSSISGTPDTIHLSNISGTEPTGYNGYELGINTTMDGDETIYGLAFGTDKPIAIRTGDSVYITANSFNVNNKTIDGNNKVQQDSSSDNKDFPLLLKYNNNSTNERNSVKYSSNITVNPSTNMLNGVEADFSGNINVGSLTIGKTNGIQQAPTESFKVSVDASTGTTISNPKTTGTSLDFLTFKADGINFFNHNGSVATLNANVGMAYSLPYGTCSTASGTSEKIVDCGDFVLSSGTRILVKFANRNTANNPKLNINGTGAKNIYYLGSAVFNGLWTDGCIMEFLYDGTNYQVIGGHTKNVVKYTNINSTISALPAGGYYKWTTVPTSITIQSISQSAAMYEPTTIILNIQSVVPTITLPSSIKWVNGTAPTPEANTILEISILEDRATYAVFK